MPSDFNPANSQIRVGHETLEGILPAAWHDHLFSSETLASEQEFIELDSIVANSQAAEPLPSTIATNGDIEVELDAEGHLAYLVNAQDKLDTTEVVTDEVFLHKLAPSESTDAPNTLQNEVWRDDDFGELFTGGRVQQLVLVCEKGSVAKATVSMLYGRSSQFSNTTVVEDGSTPNSAIPQIRGEYRYANLSPTAGTATKLWVKITDISDIGDGVIVARAKIGAGSYGSGTTFNIIGGLDANGRPVWNEVLLDSGIGAGPRDKPIEIAITNLTGQEVADEYSWDSARGVWVQSLPDVPRLNGIFTYLYIDGGRECIDGITITLTRPVEPKDCLGGAFPDQIRVRGQRVVNYSINRDYTDLALRKRLMTGEPVGIRVDLYSGSEFYTGYEHYESWISSRVKFRGRTATVTSKNEMKEQLEGQAFPNPDDGDGNVDDLVIYVQNSIEDPTA